MRSDSPLCLGVRNFDIEQVSMEDFEAALAEVKPAFGAVTETLEEYRLNGILEYSEHFRHLLATCKTLVEQVIFLLFNNIPHRPIIRKCTLLQMVGLMWIGDERRIVSVVKLCS